ELASAASSGGSYGVVLAIDASNSMRGAPIRNALAAARAFLATRNATEQVAVVTFNRSTKVVLPFTTDPKQMAATLAKLPRLGEGTHIYDAVQASLELLQHRKVAAGSIVLLSDGADTGSAIR